MSLFAPKLYTVYKIPLRDIVNADFYITGNKEELSKYKIRQQDGSMLRLIRIITDDNNNFNPYLIFVNIDKKDKEIISEIVKDGFCLNGVQYNFSERSASMSRNGILSFVHAGIIEELNKRIGMDITYDKIVLSKLYAYRGLLLSACHMLEGFLPKIIVVPDYFRTIPQQHIKFAYDDELEFIDKDGCERTWKQKSIGEDYRDIEINVFDGCGIHHPAISRQVEEILGSKTPMSSILWRMPYTKGK